MDIQPFWFAILAVEPKPAFGGVGVNTEPRTECVTDRKSRWLTGYVAGKSMQSRMPCLFTAR
jgi:hypothetical protein